MKVGTLLGLTMILLIFGMFFIGLGIASYFEFQKDQAHIYAFVAMFILGINSLMLFKFGKNLQKVAKLEL